MFRVNFDIEIKDPSGNALQEKAHKWLKMRLMSAQMSADVLKFYDIANDLGKDGFLERDRADFDKLKDFIVANQQMPVFEKAPMLLAIENKTEIKEEKKNGK